MKKGMKKGVHPTGGIRTRRTSTVLGGLSDRRRRTDEWSDLPPRHKGHHHHVPVLIDGAGDWEALILALLRKEPKNVLLNLLMVQEKS